MLRICARRHHVAIIASLVIVSGQLRGQGPVTTVVGRDWVFPASTSRALEAPLSSLADQLAIDSRGSIYWTDAGNQMVFRINPSQEISIVAGNGLAGFSGDGGDARAASLNFPGGVAVDRDDNIYISDTRNQRIRKVTTAGLIMTIAGGHGEPTNGGYSGDGGPAIDAALSYPLSVAVDSRGQIYFFDSLNNVIRKVDRQGQITVWAGTGQVGSPGTQPQPATQASLGDGLHLFVAQDDSLYVADETNSCVWVVTPNGTLRLAAGIPGVVGELDNEPRINVMADPTGISVVGNELIYSDFALNKVKKVRSDGSTVTLAGGDIGYSGDGGEATSAQLKGPKAVVVDRAGNIYFVDSGNQRLRMITPNGLIKTVAGNGRYRFSPDGAKALETYLWEPIGVGADTQGRIVIADRLNNRVLRVEQDGAVFTVAGNGIAGNPLNEGPAKDSPLSLPTHVTVKSDGTVLFGSQSNLVFQVTTDGTLKVVAGNGSRGFSGDGGPAVKAKLSLPVGIAGDDSGNIFIADLGNNRVRQVKQDGTIKTFAGTGRPGSADDKGAAISASLSGPIALAIDRQSNLYVSDSTNRVRVIDPGGAIRTFVGTGQNGFSGDGGPANQAASSDVLGLQVDDFGNVYLAEGTGRIRVVDGRGIIRTIAGNGVSSGYSGDGKAALETSLGGVVNLAVTRTGMVFILDYDEGKVRMVLPSRPVAQPLTPSEVAFRATSGGAKVSSNVIVAASQTAFSPSQVVGMATQASIDQGALAWLKVTPSAAETPALLDLSADPSALAPGDYTGTVTVRIPLASPADQILTVRLHVDQALPSQLAINSQSRHLSYPYTKGTPMRVQKLTVANAGGGVLNFTIAVSLDSGKNANWLTVSPASGQARPDSPATISVTADPGSLAIGTYTGKVTITNTSRAGDVIAIPVIMTITSNRKALLLSQTGMSFAAVEKGGIIPPQNFGVINIGQDILEWTVSTSVLGGVPNWLQATAADGSQQGVTQADSTSPVPLVTVRVNASALAAGDYYGQVRVDVPGAANTPQVLTVFLEVLKPGSDLGPVLQPTELIFTGSAGQSAPGSQDVLIYDPTGTNKTYRLGRSTSDGGSWLITSPNDATVTGDQPTRLVVQPLTGQLAPGTYRGTITLQFSDGRVRVVNVAFIVTGSGPNSGASASPTGLNRRRDADVTCTATTLVPALTTLGNDFEVPAGWPVGLRVQVSDDCGTPLDNGKVVVTFSTGYPPLGLQSLRQGRWDGTWSTKGQQLSQVMVTVTASSSDGQLTGTRVLKGGLGAVRERPTVSDGGVVSAASPIPQVPLAPGSKIAVIGERLSNTNAGGGSPLPTELAGTILTIAGRRLSLEKASDGQINAIVPFGLEINTIHQLLVQRDYTYADPIYVNMAAAQPAILTNIAGQPVIFDSTGAQVGLRNPVKAGDRITIQCTGLGAVDGGVDLTTPLPAGQTANTLELPRVSISAKDALVETATLVPGQIGVYQIRAVVPDGTAGASLSITVTAGGQTSAPVTLANQ